MVQADQPAAAGHHHQTPRRPGQQRRHLLLVGGVVQHDQHLPIGEPAAVQRRPIVQRVRDLRFGHAQGT
jgi:hypothetical protein